MGTNWNHRGRSAEAREEDTFMGYVVELMTPT